MVELREQTLVNVTRVASAVLAVSSPSSLPVRNRAVINFIYILGVVFMVTVFFVLLSINLYSRRCWCWHDTPLNQRFNRQWLLKRSMARNADASSPSLSTKHQRERRTSCDDAFSF